MPLATEPRLTEIVFQQLAHHFHLTPQVWGTHPSGERMRIDAIAVPRDRTGWSRADIALGIEFKAPSGHRPDGTRERKDACKIVSQCIDYTWTDWEGFGRVPVFFCPGFAEVDYLRYTRGVYPGTDEAFRAGTGYALAGLLGQNNAGELIEAPHLGWAFVMNATHRIWTERFGIAEGATNKLIRDSGSRA